MHGPKWNGLIEQGFLPNRRIERIEIVNDYWIEDRFMIPSNNCYMNNHRNPEDDRYCPVCQLAIIDRISQLSGVLPHGNENPGLSGKLKALVIKV